MKNYTVDNLLFLRKEYPNIYHAVRNIERNAQQYVISNTRSDRPTLAYFKSPDEALYLHSKYDPIREAEKWAQQVQVDKHDHILIYGMGLGYHIEKLMEKYPQKKIYLYEPDKEVMLAAMESRDLTKLFGHPNLISFGIGSEYVVRRQFILMVVKQFADSFTFLPLPIYEKGYKEEVATFTEDLAKLVLEYRGNLQTTYQFQMQWTENILKNYPYVLKSASVSCLQSQFHDVTAVVVGSGPSLDMDFDYLKKISHHALIICAGTSAQALLKRGLTPHMIVSMDGGEPNYEAFKDLKCSHIPYVYSPTINYQILAEKELELPFHFFFNIDKISDFLFEPTPNETFYSTATVTGTAIQLAKQMGCRRIVLVGQDLSYPNDAFYAEGVTHISQAKLQTTIRNADEWIENVQGGHNKTTKKMLNTIRDLELLLTHHMADIEVINTSSIGAKIKGTRSDTLANIYHQVEHHTLDYEQYISKLKQIRAPYDSGTLRKVQQREALVERELRTIQRSLEKIRDLMDRLDHERGQFNSKQVARTLDNIEQLWGPIANLPSFNALIRYSFQAEISIYLRVLPKIQQETDVLKKADLVIKHLGRLTKVIAHRLPSILEIFELKRNRQLEQQI